MFFLQVISGLLAISRRPASRKLRTLGMATSVVIVLLMWDECFRVALYRALEVPGVPEITLGSSASTSGSSGSSDGGGPST